MTLSSFQGRATQGQYWGVVLGILAVAAVLIVVTVIFAVAALFTGASEFLDTFDVRTAAPKITPAFFIILLLWGIFIVCANWIMLATTARRLRDAGWNPWLTLLVFSPAIGLVAVIAHFFLLVLLGIDHTETFLVVWGLITNALSLVSFVALIVFGCIPSKK